MSRSEGLFPGYWRHDVLIKWAVIAAAVVLVAKLLGVS